MLELTLHIADDSGTPTHPARVEHSLRPHRWTLDSYLRAIEAGVFPPEMRAELIDGILVVKDMPIGTPHALATRKLRKLLQRNLGLEAVIGSQEPVILGANSRPEPDAFVARGADDDYAQGDPTAADLLLICEVSNSTFAYDRTTKYKLYASAGVPEYWIVDLKTRRLLVFTEPTEAGDYAQERSFDATADFEHERFGRILLRDLFVEV